MPRNALPIRKSGSFAPPFIRRKRECRYMIMTWGSRGATPVQPLVHVAVYLSPLPLVGGEDAGTVQETGMVWEPPFQPQASAVELLNCMV